MTANTMVDKHEPGDRTPGGRYWRFVRTEFLVLLAAYAALVLIAAVTITAYAPIMGWFGFIYLVAAAISVAGVGLIAIRNNAVPSETESMMWLGIAAVVAVGLTWLYAGTYGTWSSDSPDSLVISAQLIHSTIFLISTLIAGVLWHFWLTRRTVE